jgi:hypothetical protein
MLSHIDEHAILRHIGGSANGIEPYPNDEGMRLMNSNLRGLQAGSISFVKTNVKWQRFEWRENTYQTLRKTFGEARVESSTSSSLPQFPHPTRYLYVDFVCIDFPYWPL